MPLQIGYYGDQRPQIMDGLNEACAILNANLILLDSLDYDQQIDILIYYQPPPLDSKLYDCLSSNFRVLWMVERGEPKDKIFGLGPDGLIHANDYFVIPFDPEEIAMRLRNIAQRAGLDVE